MIICDIEDDNVVLAFDDGYFPISYKSRKGYTVVVGIKTKNTYQIEGLGFGFVLVDSRDTTYKIIDIAKNLSPADAILLDGVTYAGFDVVDPKTIYVETSIPVVIVQQYPLDLDKIRKALYKNFEDAEDRFNVVREVVENYRYLDTKWKIIQYYALGIDYRKAEEILKKNMIYSPIPEPLRIAHQIASLFSRKIIEIGGPAGI